MKNTTMARPRPVHRGARTSHVRLPFQFLLGILFLTAGVLLILKYFGRDYLPFLPESVLVGICALGSVLGGFYLILARIWRPRIYV